MPRHDHRSRSNLKHNSSTTLTNKILRSMLYRGSEIMREVAWVVFDEIHYMRDKGELTAGALNIWTNILSPWCCLGRDDHTSSRQSSLCLSFGYNSERNAICGVDYENPWPAMSCCIYRFSPYPFTTLLLPSRR